ncbi:unnamed protein product [Symbiodinium sp. CCMP2592]|nr:unnamed protein product [Symbiodinium sp. CCMP2592]
MAVEAAVEAGAGDLDYLQGWRAADAIEGYTKLFFNHGGTCAQAFIVRAVASGFMLCVPAGTFSEEELQGFQAEGYPGLFGPHFNTSVPAVSVSGRELKKIIPCLFIDVAAEGIGRLQVDPFPDLELKVFGTQRLQSVWPHRVRVLEALSSFLDGNVADLPDRLDAYFTCETEGEAFPLVAPAAAEVVQNDVLQQLLMHATTQPEALAGLNARLQSLEKPAAPAPAAAAAPAGGGFLQWAPQLFNEGAQAQLQQDQVQRLLHLAGKRPNSTWARRPRWLLLRTRTPRRPSTTRLPRARAVLFPADKAPGGSGGQLNQESFGSLSILGGSSADEETKVPGIRGMAARQLLKDQIQKDPLKVYHKVCERLAQARRKSSTSALEPRDMFYHFQDVVPLGHYKTLTYFAFLLCDAWEAMEQGRSEEVMSLICLGLVFAAGTAGKHEHHDTAWTREPKGGRGGKRGQKGTKLGGRRLARWHRRHFIRHVTRHIVAANNWLVLGKPASPPAALPPLSSSQHAMLGRLEAMASTWIRLGSGPKRGLDRSVQKFDSVLLQLEELQRMSTKLFSQMQPYSKPGRGGTAAAACEPETAFSTNVTKAKLATVSKPVDPSRLSFEEAPRFQAEKFLVDPLLRAGFKDPRVFRRHASEWPRPKVARVQAPLDKQLQLYKKWDDVECLHLVPASSSEYRYRCGLFSVYKSDTLDRQPLETLYCTDASPFAAGVCAAEITASGFLFDLLEVFRGKGFDIADGPHGDIMQQQTMQHIVGLIARQLNHINVNEELSYRSLVKLLAKTQAQSGGLFPALFHIGTHDNVADDPSRLKALRKLGGTRPLWLERRRQDFLVARSEINLDATGGLSTFVAQRRDKLFSDFSVWAEGQLECTFCQLCGSGLLLSTALVAYGKHLFYSGSPKYIFSETINSCTDRFKHFRSFFASAWGVLSRWEEEEPQERSMIIPEAVYKAAISVALLWGWPFFVAALLLGFHGLLRPGEFLKLRRRDLILPSDLLTSTPIAYVRILGAKTKRFLQRQHAKISDVLAVQFLSALYGAVPLSEPLFSCSPNVCRRRWDCLFQHLGVPTGDNDRGITPKCLRGSGATWLYQMTEDIGRIQWRGRWQQRRTLEHYLQDVAGQLLLTDLTESQRSAVLELAPFATSLLSLFVSNFSRA